LNLDDAFDRVHDAGKLSEDAVACGSDEPAVMLADQEVDNFTFASQCVERRLFSLAHKPAEAVDVPADDGSELSFQVSTRGAVSLASLTARMPRFATGQEVTIVQGRFAFTAAVLRNDSMTVEQQRSKYSSRDEDRSLVKISSRVTKPRECANCNAQCWRG